MDNAIRNSVSVCFLVGEINGDFTRKAPLRFGFSVGTCNPAAPKAARESFGGAGRGGACTAARQAGELRAARLGQSACTPPDNWPISGREVRGPERIILGKGAEAGDCCGERRASSRWVRPRVRGLSQAWAA